MGHYHREPTGSDGTEGDLTFSTSALSIQRAHDLDALLIAEDLGQHAPH